MATKKKVKAKAKSKKSGKSKKPKKIGKRHNRAKPEVPSITNPLILSHHRAIQDANEKAAVARKALAAARKLARDEGLNLREYDRVIRLSKLDGDDQKRLFNSSLQIGKALKLEVADQLELFDMTQADNSKAAILKRARDEGVRDGQEGKPHSKKWDAATAAGRSYLEGYADGNKNLAQASFGNKKNGGGEEGATKSE